MSERVDVEDGKNRNVQNDFTGTVFVCFKKPSHVQLVVEGQ